MELGNLGKPDTLRTHMSWLESRIKDLAQRPRGGPKTGEQMALPFY